MVLILAGLTLSTIANKKLYAGFGAVKGWFIFPIVFGIIFYDALKNNGGLLKKSLLAIFLSGAAVSAIGLVYKLLRAVTYDGRLAAFWDSPNQLAMFLAVPFLIGVSFSFQKEENRAPYFFGVLLIGLNLFLTFSYGAWAAIVVALAVFFWLKYSRLSQKKYLFISATILLALLSLASFDKYKNIKNLGDRSSLASRFMIWKSAGRMIEDNLLFGIGPGNFQNKYLEYQKYFPPYLEWSAPEPHNIFLAFWLEPGFLGLVGFIVLLFYFFSDNKIAIKSSRDLGILFLATMIYILVHGLVDTTYWRNDLALVFWWVIAANLCAARISERASE
ncbi:MAG TPA: O-antigen ligase family protein [Candidatus Bathyarchaeia archaeon]|nr:O-antigen ligase family protein [Candidatus Bathyarchaeia archaeon]